MSHVLSEQQLDTLKEIVNIGIGQSANSLNLMLDSFIELEVPSLFFISPGESARDLTGLGESDLASVQLDFQGEFSGSSSLVFPNESAAKLVQVLTGEEPGSIGFNSVMSGTLNEIGNIVINGVIGSISNVMSTPLDFSLPNYIEGKFSDLIENDNGKAGAPMLLVTTNFYVQNLEICGHIFLVFEVGSFEGLKQSLDRLYS